MTSLHIVEDEPSLREYIAGVVRERLERMLSHADGVREGVDPEAIHQMRVWGRRSRAALTIAIETFDLGTFGKLDREVKAAAKALGEARDLDVMIEALEKAIEELPVLQQAGPQGFAEELRARRAALQDHVTQAVKRFEARGPVSRFEKLADTSGLFEADEKPLFLAAALRLGARLSELQSYEPYLYMEESAYELHQMRIAAKRLRYSLEIFEPAYRERTSVGSKITEAIDNVKLLQERLGDIHDADVMIPRMLGYLARMLTPFKGAEDDEALANRLPRTELEACRGFLALCDATAARRQKQYLRLREDWEEFASRHVFEELRDALRTAIRETEEPVTPTDAVVATAAMSA